MPLADEFLIGSQSGFKNALKKFKDMGFRTDIGPNCFAGEGVGISNTPEHFFRPIEAQGHQKALHAKAPCRTQGRRGHK